MSNEIVPFDINALPALATVSTEDLATLSKGVDHLQRIQLVTKGKYVDTGKIQPGHYGIPQPGGEEIHDLGEAIDILPLCVRPKALDVRDRDAIVAVYDMADPVFKEIQEVSALPGEQGCMWGPSFLLVERSTGQLYELFWGNKSGRAESGKLVKFLPLSAEAAKAQGVEAHGPMPCTLKSRYARRGTIGWHVPVVTMCSEPITNLPPMTRIQDEIKKFVEVKLEGPKVVAEEEAAKTGRRRAR